jgi:hypothetical protein
LIRAGSGVDLFLEADGAKSGWLCVVVFPELPEFESPRLDCVPSLEFSSVEVCERNTHMLQEPRRMDETNQGMDHLTCKFSWTGVGAWRFKVFLAATFLTAVLALTEARGAAGPEESLLLGADFIGIGWLCITTFLKGGEFLQKRTTGAGGRNLKGDPSSLTGSGPSCCCKETEQGYKASLETIARKFASKWYLFCRSISFSVKLFQQRS